jgi:pantoate--beta-alanine ligase
MTIIPTIKEMQALSETWRKAGKTIGLVPTMGALHEGHLSLVQIARDRADIVVMSIFVNPTQFGPNEDFQRYPRDFERDEKLAKQAGVDVVFNPSVEEMYPNDYATFVNVERITESLCGASRPGHFRGVTTVCAKLFLAVRPHFAVFGQKDAQQVAVIRRMVRDLDFGIEIVAAPIVREPDGLAMSSRNVYLSPEERREALCLNRSLRLAEDLIRKGETRADTVVKAVKDRIAGNGLSRIDYVEIADPDTLEPLNIIKKRALIALAVFFGKTRLIDNAVVEP